MTATLIFRVLIAVQGLWIVVEWFFGWGATAHVTSLSLRHPYASLVANAVAVAVAVALLAGVWFFQRWARLIFVLLVAVGLVTGPFRAHYYFSSPPSYVQAISIFMLLSTGAIVAMSFLPPVRDRFVKNGA